MTDVRDTVDWKDKRKIWARIASVKSAVTRACTAINKLIDREYTVDTMAASRDARKRLLEAFDFCVELHDRWSDLEILDGNESASETAEVSIKPYEEKQFASLKKLDQYIAENAKAQAATSAAESDRTSNIPKLSTCKLLFPEKLSKSKTPCEYGLNLRVSAPAPKMALVSFSGNRKKITSMNFFNSDFFAFVADKIDADLIQKYYRSIFSIICCKNFLQ